MSQSQYICTAVVFVWSLSDVHVFTVSLPAHLLTEVEQPRDAVDPFRTWGRSPAFDPAAQDGRWGAFGNSNPWKFELDLDPSADVMGLSCSLPCL